MKNFKVTGKGMAGAGRWRISFTVTLGPEERARLARLRLRTWPDSGADFVVEGPGPTPKETKPGQPFPVFDFASENVENVVALVRTGGSVIPDDPTIRKLFEATLDQLKGQAK